MRKLWENPDYKGEHLYRFIKLTTLIVALLAMFEVARMAYGWKVYVGGVEVTATLHALLLFIYVSMFVMGAFYIKNK